MVSTCYSNFSLVLSLLQLLFKEYFSKDILELFSSNLTSLQLSDQDPLKIIW